MCDAASAVMIGVALAGAAVQHQGAKKAGAEAKRTIARKMAATEKLRKKALGQSQDVVNQEGADALAADAQKPQAEVQQQADTGDTIAKAFADSAGVSSSNMGKITGAVSGARRTATNEATGRGFSNALQLRAARLGNLTTNNLLLGADSARIQAALPYELQQAGEAGANQRLIGGLLGVGAQGAMSNQAWQKKPSTAGMGGAV